MGAKGVKEKKAKKGLFSTRNIDATKRNYKREVEVKCPTCKGTKVYRFRPCNLCKGTGKVWAHP
jgi:DnaJ-class molecular chaperone